MVFGIDFGVATGVWMFVVLGFEFVDLFPTGFVFAITSVFVGCLWLWGLVHLVAQFQFSGF